MAITNLTILAVASVLDGQTVQFPVYVEAHGGGYRSRAMAAEWSRTCATVEEAVEAEADLVLMDMAAQHPVN